MEKISIVDFEESVNNVSLKEMSIGLVKNFSKDNVR